MIKLKGILLMLLRIICSLGLRVNRIFIGGIWHCILTLRYSNRRRRINYLQVHLVGRSRGRKRAGIRLGWGIKIRNTMTRKRNIGDWAIHKEKTKTWCKDSFREEIYTFKLRKWYHKGWFKKLIRKRLLWSQMER